MLCKYRPNRVGNACALRLLVTYSYDDQVAHSLCPQFTPDRRCLGQQVPGNLSASYSQKAPHAFPLTSETPFRTSDHNVIWVLAWGGETPSLWGQVLCQCPRWDGGRLRQRDCLAACGYFRVAESFQLKNFPCNDEKIALGPLWTLSMWNIFSMNIGT